MLKAVGVAGFDVVIEGAETQRAGFVASIAGVGQDDGVQIVKSGGGANPFEEQEAVGGGELQIDDEEVGKRMVGAIGVRRFGKKIIEGLLDVADEAKGGVEMLFGAGALENKRVVLIIFDDQDDPGRLVRSFFQRMKGLFLSEYTARNSDEMVS